MVWKVVIHDSAVHELRTFKRKDQQSFKAIVEALTQISSLPDPRKSGKVCHLGYDAPGWYRLKLTYPKQIRVIFRLLQHDGKQYIEIGEYGTILRDTSDEDLIQITQVSLRNARTYGDPLHRRYFSLLEAV